MTNKTAALLKAGIANQFSINRYRTLYGVRNIAMVFAIGLTVMLYLIFSASIGLVYYEIGKEIGQGENISLIVSVAYIGASVLCVLASITQASSYLFNFTDYNMLAALPVKDSSILICKLIMLYFANMLINTAVFIPGVIAYGIFMRAGLTYWILGFVLYLMLPLLPMALGSFISFVWIIYIEKYRFSNLVLSIFILSGVLAVVLLNIFFAAESDTVADVVVYVNYITQKFYPAALFTDALSRGSVRSTLWIAFLYITVFGGFVLCFPRVFRVINSDLTEDERSADYKLGKLTYTPQVKSLFIKEAKFYFSSYIYMVNTLIIVLIPTAASIFFIFTGANRFTIPDRLVIPVLFISASLCISLTPITASAISFESKNLWILKSIPVRFFRIAAAKVGFATVITSSVLLFNCILLSLHYKLDIGEFLVLAVLIVLDCLLMSIIGLFINLLFPKLIWISHVQVVKQSMSVIISVLSGLVITAGFWGLYLNIPDKSNYAFICMIMLLTGCFFMGIILLTKGKTLFYRLKEE